MMRRGETRTVFTFWPLPVAFKIARGRLGVLCNKHEAALYRRNRDKPHRRAMLCPVLWRSSDGRLLVARCADTPISEIHLQFLKRDRWAWSKWDYAGGGDDPCPFEWKSSDWGYLNGKVVAIDYAATVNA
jgi:hypothetical protein